MGSGSGLSHLALKVGTDHAQLWDFANNLGKLDVPVLRIVDHCQIKSIYFNDPDGLLLEA
jgi:catechol-2,3-dioxygenase